MLLLALDRVLKMIFVKGIFVLLTTGFLLTAESFTWTAPPPAWTPIDANDIRTVKFPVLNGSTNVALRWNYTLGTGELLASKTWQMDGKQIALVGLVTMINDDRFAVDSKEVATLIIKDVSEIEDATIQLIVQTTINIWKYNIRVEITVPPRMTSYSDNQTVKEGFDLTLLCNSTGKPPPNITWTRVSEDEVLFVGNPWHIANINRTYSGTYRCIADNGVPSPVNSTISINVLYGPLANPLKIKTVTEGELVAIPCLKDNGNPPAVVTWYKGNDTSGNETTNSSVLEFQNAAPSNEGWYTCFAKSDVRNASATFFLNVVQKTSSAPITEPSTASILCSKVPSENELRVSVTVEADCENRTQVAEKLVNKIVELLKNEGCELGVSCGTNCSSGTMVVDSVLKFSKAIDGARVVSILKEAAEQGRFDGLKVVSNSIIQISYTTTSLASTESPSPTEPVCRKSFFEKENCEKNWLIIGILIGSMVLLCVIICCLITRWVLKQRKCKKDTRVANSAVDVQPLSSNHSTLSGDKPCDYAMSGPQPPVEVEVAVCEEIPTYAVVDKAKKKDKKKNKKAAEQKAIDDQYAAVDKSKKNKKNEPDNTYAEVDMSNKSKKKPKLGEVLYADLGEFHQMQKLPEVSTSPKTLPPIKRPEAYAETQYADITQFLKGNPEASGADHPKDGAASSASSNGQGSATGRKEESSAGNTGDSAGATNDTGF